VNLREKKATARRARRYGYHVRGVEIYVYCPLCRSQVVGDWSTATKQVRTLTAELDRAMVAHLTDECSACEVAS